MTRIYEGNYGKTGYLTVYNGTEPDYRTLLKFDVQKLKFPDDAKITKVYLQLYAKSSQAAENRLYAVSRNWQEGTGTFANTLDGVTWLTYDGQHNWAKKGGDFDNATDFGHGANGIVDSLIPGTGLIKFDITTLFKQWISEERNNYGVLITHPNNYYYRKTEYLSKESGILDKMPKLIIEYTSESQGQENSSNQDGQSESSGQVTDNSGGQNSQTVIASTSEILAEKDVQIFKYLFFGKQEANGNYGALDSLTLYNGLNESVYRSLLKFDLSSLPKNAEIQSAYLQLWASVASDGTMNNLYRITKPWTEGTGTWGNTVDGASWTRSDGQILWDQEGADFDLNLVTLFNPQVGFNNFDLTDLVKKWVTGEVQNYGLVMTIPENLSYTKTIYASKEYGDASKRPRLVVEYVVR